MIVFPIFLFIATWTFYRLAWKYNRNGVSNAIFGFSIFLFLFLSTVGSITAIIHYYNNLFFGSFWTGFTYCLKSYFMDRSIGTQLIILVPAVIVSGLVLLIKYLRFKKSSDIRNESENILDQLPK